MDYLKKIDDIINTLNINNKKEFSEIVMEEKKNSFTSSELLMKVGYILNRIINNNSEIDNIIGKDVRELLAYSKKIGLQIGSV